MKRPLIGTGFYADGNDLSDALKFYALWLTRIGPRQRVVVNNCASTCVFASDPWTREIRLYENTGHVKNFLCDSTRQLLGWSMSWIIPAMIAYAEIRDFIYVEQDCLVFGEWERHIVREAAEKGWRMACGPKHDEGNCEQSLFWIKWDFIPDFVALYMAIKATDGVIMPEEKFTAIQAMKPTIIGSFTLPGGRKGPRPYDAEAWYGQHFTNAELEELRKLRLV